MTALPALPSLLLDLTTVLGVAALTSLLFQRLRLPVVLGYLLAGLIVGPHVPIPLVADQGHVETLAQLGIVLLLFSIGLEFNLRKLLQAGLTALMTGTIQVGLAVWLCYLAGRAFGWSRLESVFMGAAFSISSTMIIAKLMGDRERDLRTLVFSVLVVQDLWAIVLLALLSTTASMGGPHLGWTLARLALFLGGLLAGGGFVVPRLVRWVADHGRDETLLVVTVGLCFSLSVLAARMGFSLALGAFVAGMLVSESGRARKIERLVAPLRDVFTAVFFVAVGMLMDPRMIPSQAGPILAFTALVMMGNTLAIALGASLAGQSLDMGLRAGLAMAQTGEFSFIVIGAGVAMGVLRPGLYPVAAAVCILTALATPFLLRHGEGLSAWIRGMLPPSLLESLAVYRSWTRERRTGALRRGPGAPLRRPALFLLLDTVLLQGTLVGSSLAMARSVAWLEAHSPVGHLAALAALLLGTILLATALSWAILRRCGELAQLLLALPGRGAGAPGSLLPALQGALVVAVAVPTLAIVQPFLPQAPTVLLVLGLVGTVLLRLRLGHRPSGRPPVGSEWLIDKVGPWGVEALRPPETEGGSLTLRLPPSCPVLGLPLAALALEEAGAMVVALVREGRPQVPHPALVLEAEDLLALSGTPAALETARTLLGNPGTPAP